MVSWNYQIYRTIYWKLQDIGSWNVVKLNSRLKKLKSELIFEIITAFYIVFTVIYSFVTPLLFAYKVSFLTWIWNANCKIFFFYEKIIFDKLW